MDEKLMPLEVTSGTPERVVLSAEQVMLSARSLAMVLTSAGRATVPVTKQGEADCLVCRGIGPGYWWHQSSLLACVFEFFLLWEGEVSFYLLGRCPEEL